MAPCCLEIEMSVKELETAIADLSREEQDELAEWLDRHLEAQWDQQIARDGAAGRLNGLLAEARADIGAGRRKTL